MSRFARAALVSLALVLWATGARAEADSGAAQQASQLLEYISVDYPSAVQAGEVVSSMEYQEQIEFLGRVGALLETLGVQPGDALVVQLTDLEGIVQTRGSSDRVTSLAREMVRALGVRFGVQALPRRLPSRDRGRSLYAEACVQCHGENGLGDGPAAASLDPAPSDFSDRERMLSLSLSAVYTTISLGIEGTAMAGNAHRFSESDQWALALFVGSLAFPPEEVARGRALLAQGHSRVASDVPSLAVLVQEPVVALAQDDDSLAVLAYLRTHPEALEQGDLPIGIARRKLAESFEAYQAGDADRAMDLAISAYLDGFEMAEPALDVVDRDLRVAIEEDFLRYRALLGDARDPKDVALPLASLQAGLDEAQSRLDGGDLSSTAQFVAALTIVCREGLEALLIVVALCGVLIRAGRRDALRFVHAGWISAGFAGAGTWLATRTLVELSGANREVIEGVTSLIAVAILFYVSFWLVSRAEAKRWQRYLDAQMRAALSRGSLFALALVSFTAVYRELLESILFFQALSAQAGDTGPEPLLLGIGAGALLLTLPAVGMLRYGARLPLPQLFAGSSALLYGLAVIMAGRGVAALQEAGWLSATWVNGIRIEWLGIYPTVETLVSQGLLVAVAVAAIPWTLTVLRSGDPQEVR